MKRIASLILFVLPACVASPEDAAPRILVDACAGGSESVGAFTGGVSACALTLQLAVAAPTNIIVTLMNPSSERLTLTSVELSPESVASYSLVESPAVVPAGETAEVVVVARALVLGTTTASLVIRSDAVNAETITVEIRGNAIDAGLPDLVAPDGCDFGEVPLSGDVARCEVLLSNAGVRDLILDGAFVADCDEDCAFRFSPPVAAGTVLPPGTNASLALLFRPDALGAFEAVLTILTNDPDESPLDVLLTAVVVP